LKAIDRYAAQDDVPSEPEPPLQDELAGLKRQFLRNRLQDLAVIEEAIREKAFDQIRTIGHRIKGLAGSYGLDDITAIGDALEQAALRHDVEAIGIQQAKLTEALHRAEATDLN
jgi:HPt (histidine-containing phosphotransfer) domain-containing protein